MASRPSLVAFEGTDEEQPRGGAAFGTEASASRPLLTAGAARAAACAVHVAGGTASPPTAVGASCEGGAAATDVVVDGAIA